MKILYVTSEANPYAATGGLGDVMGSLPQAVKALRRPGTEVSVMMPLYQSVSPVYRKKMKKVCDCSFNLGWRSTGCSVYSLSSGGVTFYFLENNYYFQRTSMYGNYDDGERFAFFSRAVLESLITMDYAPDILHANDWQSALSIVYLKAKFSDLPQFAGVRTVFTIHNIEYQGKYDSAILGDIFDLDEVFRPVVDYDGCINRLKRAMVSADHITTVSAQYAKELRDPYFAYGLHPIVQMCEEKMSGIINGLDVRYYSSENAEGLVETYKPATVKEGKAANKRALQEQLGLPCDPKAPLIAMVTRLTPEKGVDLLLHVFDELMARDVQFVLLGSGSETYENLFTQLCNRYGDRARALIKFDRTLSKSIYAAADIFLMPSKREPCGLAQMIACRYGTVPIVHAVGGLHDSIIPAEEEGNGFPFANFNAHEMFATVERALDMYRSAPAEWDALVQRAMKSDFRWNQSAKRYMQLYESLLANK